MFFAYFSVLYNIYNKTLYNMENNDKFYLLGLIFADGYLIKHKKYNSEYIGITLIDEQILKEIADRLNINLPKKAGKTSANNDLFRLRINDKKLMSDFKEFGLVERKSLILKLYKDIPEGYMWDFIRGYFDGDGCIHFSLKKGRINSYGSTFSILGTCDILAYIGDFFKKNNINCKIHKYRKIYNLTVCHYEGIKIIYEHLYENKNSLMLTRKYIHFTEFINQKEKSLQEQKTYKKKPQSPRMSNLQFQNKMKEMYKEYDYDFSNSLYTKSNDMTTFFCPIHGIVKQKINYLMRGRGCPKCTKKYADAETFKLKAEELHGKKYDYSKVEYKNNKTKVCIICPEHGEFWQTPSNHLLGRGCPECGKIKNYSARAKENKKKQKLK